MLSDKLNGVKLEKPILQWVQDKNSSDKNTLLVLMKVYRRTNDLYDERFTSVNNIIDQLTELLSKLEEYEGENNQNSTTEKNAIEKVSGFSSETINKAKRIVKANILLRRGQVKANEFIESSNDFQAACAILEYTIQKSKFQEDCSLDFLDFLAWLNLGKYFRNMGMYHGRSDYYWRAHDEFVGILKALKNRIITENSESSFHEPWELYILLETVMNLSRTKLYLYKTKEAKIYLWSVYFKIYNRSGKKSKLFYNKDSKEISEMSKQLNEFFEHSNDDLTWMQKLIEYFEKPIDSKDNNDSKQNDITNEYSDMLNGYLIQVLVQLGICYRKTRDYKFSREIFVDILNNVY